MTQQPQPAACTSCEDVDPATCLICHGTDQPDRCARCWCEDCGGTLAKHTSSTCGCESCVDYPDLACTASLPPRRIAILAEQLGPLLSVHLGPRQQRRCLAVAHAAPHAILDYDHAGENR